MILYALFIFLVLYLVFRYAKPFHLNGLPKQYVSYSFIIKTISGITFISIYTHYYGKGVLSADAEQFMRESKLLNDVFFHSVSDYFSFIFGTNNSNELIQKYLSETSHWSAGDLTLVNDNRNILRVHSVFHFISFNNPYIHVLFMAVLSTIATNNFYLSLKNRSNITPKYLFMIFVLFPSLLFWSSSLLKEPLLILGISLFLRSLLYSDPKAKRVLYFILGLIFTVGFKPYIFFILIVSFVFYLIFYTLPKYKLILSMFIFIGLGIISLFIFENQREKAIQILSRKQYDFVNISKGGIHVTTDTTFYFFKPRDYDHLLIIDDSVQVIKDIDAEILHHGSIDQPIPIHLLASKKKWKIYFQRSYSKGYIETTPLGNSGIQLIKNIPEAISNALFRPYISDPGGWLKFPAILENILLFAFLIHAIIRRKKLTENEIGIIASIIIFILLLSLLIGWTTPVLGAIVRYRVPAYLGIIIIITMTYSPLKSSK